MTINVNGGTPLQSRVSAGTITPYIKTQGNGKRRKVYRVQYNTMYFNYGSMAEAVSKRNKWVDAGSIK